MTHDPRADDAVDPVRVDGVSVTLGGTRVLDDVDLTVCPGEAVALLGANGSGKSTLVRALLGQAPLGAGAAWLFGAPTRDAGAVPWERIGYVPQRISAASGVPATALEVVQTGLLGRRRWWLGRSDRVRAREALAELDVADLADRPFHVLSGGQQQRVVIARALVREPDLLVMDEPLAGVDLLTQTSFARLLRERHDQGTALVLVLHELGPFADLLDRAVVLRGGQVVHDGDLPRDHGHPEHPHHDHLHTDHGRPAEPSFPGSLP